jgi:hypothetical protein
VKTAKLHRGKKSEAKKIEPKRKVPFFTFFVYAYQSLPRFGDVLG